MSDMVLVWCQKGNFTDDTLLILKERPAWQKGRLNLPGGKMEAGETPVETAIRELKEETGYEPIMPPRVLGRIQDGPKAIYCLKVRLMTEDDPRPQDGETEKAFWVPWYRARQDSRLLPNLRVIIPLLMSGVSGWVIHDQYRSEDVPDHSFTISVPTSYE